MKILKWIPNLLTLLNLLSGCFAVVYAVNNQIQFAVLFVLLGIFFDFFDGFAARIFKVQSEIGKQLDSLADMVTSGVVPGVVMVQMLLKSGNQEPINYLEGFENFPFLAMLGFAITLASCYRLANFNIDENQKENFVGLPTPANTLLIVSLPLMHAYPEYHYISYIVDNQYVLILLTILSCYMLNANIELFALKFKTFGFAENKLKYIFLSLSILMILVLKLAAIPAIIFTYLLLSMLSRKK
ncbi:phosphatidylcholine/phosphatidylserine synthase [Wenyingzhuangia sp. 2_MG-2023]|uniref:CDP-alcohol phosphatidyltransferase family protein n=1 Tax=Wenyingzhuangia sp. 2_MG-2023 TaxID=3062639 RepID=UPI0026E13A34|nr:CDP-alcohol phosphatidyltransferase family protein [Wenyingzhuangia sp. 2_MG-2023]MDO6738897.1 CDP-alcohol phosphatidyltransferase family protein [Wenyingzhuangia sp. 2_MG-2023]MDO6802913.1 CDP-alcohol phosphatidyltransferase family protein [Wenyingzhuangia sp. 1_MG-2023]